MKHRAGSSYTEPYGSVYDTRSPHARGGNELPRPRSPILYAPPAAAHYETRRRSLPGADSARATTSC